MEVNKFWLLILSVGYLLVAIKLASSIFVNQLNEIKPKSSKTQFQFQFELSLAQLSPSLLIIYNQFSDFFLPRYFLDSCRLMRGDIDDSEALIFASFQHIFSNLFKYL